jgi:hypothetical protein
MLKPVSRLPTLRLKMPKKKKCQKKLKPVLP